MKTDTKLTGIFLLGSILLFVLACVGPANAAERNDREIEFRLGTGIKSVFSIGLGGLPVPVALEGNVDIKKFFRVGVEFHHNVLDGFNRFGINPGLVLPIVGGDVPAMRHFQFKIPLMWSVGAIIGSAQAADGYVDDLKWVVVGPAIGFDFSWWSTSRVIGFWMKIGFGYVFRIDAGSVYEDGYSAHDDKTGTPEASFILGVCF